MSKPEFFYLLRSNLKNPIDKRESVKEILQGYDLNQVDDMGRNILHWMPIWTSGENDIFQLLIDLGANVNHLSHDGISPLHLAVFNGEPGYVKSLLEAGAKQNTRDKSGNIPRDLLRFEKENIKALLNAYLS